MSNLNQGMQKILVVDGEKNYRIVFARLFEGVGYQVFLADSPASALNFLQNEKVSLLLTDLQMVGMNGLDFCQTVHREIGDIPTVVFTGNASSLCPDAMSSAGVLSCLEKPFDNQVILSLVADILSKRPNDPCTSRRDNTSKPLIDEFLPEGA